MQQTKTFRIQLVVAMGLLGASLMGCGGQAFGTSVAHPAMQTESDRYGAALAEAYTAYASEVEAASEIAYPTSEAASEAARAVASDRFDTLLDAALHRRGMTQQGLRLHASHHPAFLQYQREVYRPGLARLQERAVAISDTVPAPTTFGYALLTTDASPTTLALAD